MTSAEILASGTAPEDSDYMEFRLVFTGSMKSGQGSGMVEEKHTIRKAIHKQLAKLWEAVPDLKMRTAEHSILHAPAQEYVPVVGLPGGKGKRTTMAAAVMRDSLLETLGNNFNKCGYKFVPLVNKHLNLTCGLDVLLLQRDGASPLRRGKEGTDIDNRLKTLFDGLQVPQYCSDIPSGTVKDPDEDPYFFCLLEDDRLVTDVKVITDRWLAPYAPPPGPASHPENFVHAVVTVRVQPSVFSFENLAFVT
jgi:hypothetical protein